MTYRKSKVLEVARLKNELRIASCMAKLKRDQADRAEERERDVAKQLEVASAVTSDYIEIDE